MIKFKEKIPLIIFLLSLFSLITAFFPVYIKLTAALKETMAHYTSLIEKEYALSISYSGLSPSLLKRIRMKNVKIKSTLTGEELLSVEKINLRYSIISLIKGDFENAVKLLDIRSPSLGISEDAFLRHRSFLEQKFKGKKKNNSKISLNLPFDILLSNVTLRFKENKNALTLYFAFLRLAKQNQKKDALSLSSKGGLSLSTASETFSSSFSFSASIKEELKESYALVKLSENLFPLFSLSPLSFLITYEKGAIITKTQENFLPLELCAKYDLHAKTLDAVFESEELHSKELITFREKIKIGNTDLKDITLTAGAKFHADFRTKKMKYSASGNAFLPLFADENEAVQAVFSLNGDEKSVIFPHAAFYSPSLDASGNASYVYKTGGLAGEMDIKRLTLKNQNVISSEWFFEGDGKNLFFFTPELHLNDMTYTALEAHFSAKKDKIRAELTMLDFTHPEAINEGQLKLKAEMDKKTKEIKISSSLNSVFYDSIAKSADFFLWNSKSLFLPLSPYIFSGTIDLSCTKDGFSFNIPYAVSANTEIDDKILYFSIKGNDKHISIRHMDYVVKGKTDSLTAEADLNLPEKKASFTGKFINNLVPLSFSGRINGTSLTLEGEHSLSVKAQKIKDAFKADIAFTDLPFEKGEFLFSFSSLIHLTYSKKNGFNASFPLLETQMKNPKLPFTPIITISGNAQKTNVNFTRINYRDQNYFLNGSGEFICEKNDSSLSALRMKASFFSENENDVVSFNFSLDNPENSVPVSFTNLINFYTLSSTLEVKKLDLSTFFYKQNVASSLSARVEASGTLKNPEIKIDVKEFFRKKYGKILTVSSIATLKNKKLSLKNLLMKYNNLRLTSSFAEADLENFTGKAKALLTTSVTNKSIEIPLSFSLTDTVKTKNKKLSSFHARLESENVSGELIARPFPFFLDLNYADETYTFTTSENISLNGFYKKNGELYAEIPENKTLSFIASGKIRNKKIDVNIKNVKADAKELFSYFNTSTFRVLRGNADGEIKIEGLIKDPIFSGKMYAHKAACRLKNALTDVITLDEAVATFEDNAIKIPKSEGRVKGKYPIFADLGVYFSGWEFRRLTSAIQTSERKMCPINLKTKTFRLNGFAAADILLLLEDGVFTTSGKIKAKKTSFSMGKDLADIEGAFEKIKIKKETKKNSRKLQYACDLDILLINQTKFQYDPFLRLAFMPNTKLSVKFDADTKLLTMDGDLEARGGDISYLNQTFYIKNGTLKSSKQTASFDPIINLEAEARMRDENNKDYKLLFSVKNQLLSKLNPHIASIPPRSNTDLQRLMGVAATGGAKNTSDLLFSAGNYALQSTIGRKMEDKITSFLNVNVFSFRSNILQNALKTTQNSSNGGENGRTTGMGNDNSVNMNNFSLGKLFDNSTLYIGKYLSQNLYADALLKWNYDEFSANPNDMNKLSFSPEFGLELSSPFANIRLATSPNFNSIKQGNFLSTTSLSFSWKFMF